MQTDGFIYTDVSALIKKKSAHIKHQNDHFHTPSAAHWTTSVSTPCLNDIPLLHAFLERFQIQFVQEDIRSTSHSFVFYGGHTGVKSTVTPMNQPSIAGALQTRVFALHAQAMMSSFSSDPVTPELITLHTGLPPAPAHWALSTVFLVLLVSLFQCRFSAAWKKKEKGTCVRLGTF